MHGGVVVAERVGELAGCEGGVLAVGHGLHAVVADAGPAALHGGVGVAARALGVVGARAVLDARVHAAAAASHDLLERAVRHDVGLREVGAVRVVDVGHPVGEEGLGVGVVVGHVGVLAHDALVVVDVAAAGVAARRPSHVAHGRIK